MGDPPSSDKDRRLGKMLTENIDTVVSKTSREELHVHEVWIFDGHHCHPTDEAVQPTHGHSVLDEGALDSLCEHSAGILIYIKIRNTSSAEYQKFGSKGEITSELGEVDLSYLTRFDSVRRGFIESTAFKDAVRLMTDAYMKDTNKDANDIQSRPPGEWPRTEDVSCRYGRRTDNGAFLHLCPCVSVHEWNAARSGSDKKD